MYDVTSVNIQKTIENGHRKVDLPIQNGESFHSFCASVYTIWLFNIAMENHHF